MESPLKTAVSQHFSRAARSYDAHAELQLAVGRSLVQRLPSQLVTPAALDLGCATAPFARAQQQALPEVLWQAVDLSSEMLNEAAERGRLNDHYQPLCADAESLPLEASSQGLVFSCFALQWCDPTRVMAEVHRVLAPGGRLQQQVMVEYYDSVKQIARRLKATGADHVNGASGLTGKNAWQAMVAEYETKRTGQGLPLTWNVLFLEAEKL